MVYCHDCSGIMRAAKVCYTVGLCCRLHNLLLDIQLQVRLPVSGLKALDPEVTEHSLVSGLLYSIRQQPQLKGSPPKAKLQPKPVVRSARQQARRAQHPASLPAGDQDVTMDISNGA